MKEKEESNLINTYADELCKLYDEVFKETIILFEMLDNWPDLSILFKECELQEVIQGVFKKYS